MIRRADRSAARRHRRGTAVARDAGADRASCVAGGEAGEASLAASPREVELGRPALARPRAAARAPRAEGGGADRALGRGHTASRPDLVLCSTAVRAQATLELVLPSARRPRRRDRGRPLPRMRPTTCSAAVQALRRRCPRCSWSVTTPACTISPALLAPPGPGGVPDRRARRARPRRSTTGSRRSTRSGVRASCARRSSSPASLTG